MEDFIINESFFIQDNHYALIAVLDGHGGD